MFFPNIIDFTVNKKKSILFLLVVVLSVIITSAPIVTVSYIGLEKSLFLMFSMEFIVGVVVYFCFFHVKESAKIVTKTTLIAFFVLFFIQFLAYTSKPHSVGLFHVSRENINSLMMLIFFIPFYEEVFYRGCLLGFFSTIMGNWFTSIAATSLFFCAMHTQYSSLVDYYYLFIISIVLCVVRIKNKNLLSPFFLHMSMNAWVVFLNIQSYF